MRKILRHTKFFVAVVSSAGFASIGLLGGLAIQPVKEQLLLFTPLFVALPAMNAMAGDYATIITAHIGDPETHRITVFKLLKALGISLPISIVGICAMSLFIAYLRGYNINLDESIRYFTFVATALTGVVVVTLGSVFGLNVILKKKQLNSDDILIPAANTLASVLMLSSFAIIVGLIN